YILFLHTKATERGLKAKNPAGNPAGFAKFLKKLTFAVLETFAGTRLSVFFALAHARVAGQEPFGFQDGTQVRVDRHECPGNAVAHSASLAIGPSTGDSYLHVKFVGRAGHSQRLGDHRTMGFGREIIFKRAPVDLDFA